MWLCALIAHIITYGGISVYKMPERIFSGLEHSSCISCQNKIELFLQKHKNIVLTIAEGKLQKNILCLATPEGVGLKGLKCLIHSLCAKPFVFVETSRIKGFMAQKFFCGLPYEPFKNDLGDGILSLQPRKGSA